MRASGTKKTAARPTKRQPPSAKKPTPGALEKLAKARAPQQTLDGLIEDLQSEEYYRKSQAEQELDRRLAGDLPSAVAIAERALGHPSLALRSVVGHTVLPHLARALAPGQGGVHRMDAWIILVDNGTFFEKGKPAPLPVNLIQGDFQPRDNKPASETLAAELASSAPTDLWATAAAS